jgi:hypothetical protein
VSRNDIETPSNVYITTMGKKSKNPRKAKKAPKPKNTDYFPWVVDSVLHRAQLREEGFFVPRKQPESATPCLHLNTNTFPMEKLEELQRQLKEFQGKRVEGEDNLFEELIDRITSSLQKDEHYRHMKEVIIATGVDYLLRFDCSQEDSDTKKFVEDLISMFLAYTEVEECVQSDNDEDMTGWGQTVGFAHRGRKYICVS